MQAGRGHRNFGLVVVALLWLAAGLWPRAAAALVLTPKGISISPVFTDVSIKKDDRQATHVVTIKNSSGLTQAFTLSAVDFGSLNEEGGVAFLGQTTDELGHPHGLSAWMKLDRSSVTIPANEAADIRVTIDNRASLASGGHYGAVLATAVTDNSSTKAQVGVRQVLSSLILVIKEDGSRQSFRLITQTSNRAFWHLPDSISHRFENQGNVHVVPRGVVTITDPAGRVVRRGALNDGSGAILPGSFRRYQTPLDVLARAWMPGRYQMTIVYRADGSDATQTATVSLWFGGAPIIWVVFLLVIAAISALGWWTGRKLRRRR